LGHSLPHIKQLILLASPDDLAPALPLLIGAKFNVASLSSSTARSRLCLSI